MPIKLPSRLPGEEKEDKFKGQPHLKKAFKEFDRLMQPILDREAKIEVAVKDQP